MKKSSWIAVVLASLALVNCGGSGAGSDGTNDSADPASVPPVGKDLYGKLADVRYTTSLGADIAVRFAISDFVNLADPGSETLSYCGIQDLPDPNSQFRAVYFEASLVGERPAPAPYVRLGFRVVRDDGSWYFTWLPKSDVFPVAYPVGLSYECIPKQMETLFNETEVPGGLLSDTPDSFIATNFFGVTVQEEVEPGRSIARSQIYRIEPGARLGSGIRKVEHAILLTESYSVFQRTNGLDYLGIPSSVDDQTTRVIPIADVQMPGSEILDIPMNVSVRGQKSVEQRVCDSIRKLPPPAEVYKYFLSISKSDSDDMYFALIHAFVGEEQMGVKFPWGESGPANELSADSRLKDLVENVKRDLYENIQNEYRSSTTDSLLSGLCPK